MALSGTPTTYPTSNPARALTRSFPVRTLVFLGLHIPLAFVVSTSSLVAAGYGLVILLVGVRAAIRNEADHVLYTLAYLASAEILLRMNRAPLPWEYGKYAVVAIALVAILAETREQVRRRQPSILLLLYLLLLLPAIIPVALQLSLAEALDDASFSLSGHLALAFTAYYLWRRPINRPATVRLLLAIMAPTIAIGTVAIYTTIITEIDFTLSANWISSGNYGPNQVSNMLGLGALAGLLLFTLLPRSGFLRIIILLISAALIAQGLLTFSRGGIYSLSLAMLAFGFHLTNTPRARRRFLVLALLTYVVGAVLVFPSLDNYTGGALSLRFADLNTTGRLEVAEGDLLAFSSAPLTGTGLGLATSYRELTFGRPVAAHTEFTRLMAEHGLLGLAAIIVLLWMPIARYRDTRRGPDRAMVATFAIWSLSVMLQSAMRFAAISFIFSLALVAWQLEIDESAPDDASA